jgi:predicted NBD/HSP70 family sugar kinase
MAALRPALRPEPSPEGRFALGIDVGGTKVAGAIVEGSPSCRT